MSDLAGVDIGWHRDPNRIESIRDALAAEGRWGQKKQAGFYDYDEKRTPSESPRVAEIIEEFRAKAGVQKRATPDQEIIERTPYPTVNEGALNTGRASCRESVCQYAQPPALAVSLKTNAPHTPPPPPPPPHP